jgi:hypothetical protein
MWPDSSPLCQSRPRERLQYTASPRSAVWRSASRFMNANINTSFVPSSCAITGTSPCASHFTSSSQSMAVSVASAQGSRCVAPSKPRSSANQRSTGTVPGSTGTTCTGSVCQAIACRSRISNAPDQSKTLQKCSRTRACG